MKKITYLIISIVLITANAMSQTNEKLSPEFGGRLSATFDKKIVKGLHINIGEEVRFDNNFKSFDRFQTTVGISYKVNSYFKFGGGYALINQYSTSSKSFKSARHRFMFDVKGTVKAGEWNFSLKERIQLTHRSGSFNIYQNPANAVMLKSRIKVKYDGFEVAAPYAYVELRHYLNAPVVEAAFDGSCYYTVDDYQETGEAGWFLKDGKGAYLNRVRTTIGTEIDINEHNALDVYFMADYVRDKVIDANAEGTKLKSYTKETGFVGWIGVAYKLQY